MYLYRIAILVVLILTTMTLAWCGSGSDSGSSTQTWTQSAYYIQVSKLSQLKKPLTLSKAGKLLWSSNLIISAQVPGRVSQIPVVLWSQVRKWDLLIRLQDYAGNYSINVKRASNAIQWAQISYQTTVTNFDKQAQDARIALEDATFKIEKIQADIQAQKAKIVLDLQNASVSNTWSSANLQLNQILIQLEKGKLDLEAKRQADSQTIENFLATYQVLIRDLNLLYENVIDETDKIMGMRIQTQSLNDNFEPYLGVKNTSTRLQAENQMLQVINYQQTYQQLLNKPVTIDQLASQLKSLLDWLKKLNTLLSSINTMLLNSIASTTFGQGQLDGMISSINALQAQVQGQMSSITSQQNAIQSFLASYQSQQDSITKSLDSLQQQYLTTSKNLSDWEILANLANQRQQIAFQQALKGAELGLQQAQNLNTITSRQKNNNLSALSNTIQWAQIWYQDAVNQLSKMIVKSPIDGIVGNILVDMWQDVWIGTPLIQVYNNTKPQIEITLGKEEIRMVAVGSLVKINIWSQWITWYISSIGTVSDNNFMTKAIIDIPQTVGNLWDVVDIVIPVDSDILLVPLTSITLLNSQLGQILVYQGTWYQIQEVKLGKVYGDLVHVQTDLDPDIMIITSSLDTYNPQEQVLTVKS